MMRRICRQLGGGRSLFGWAKKRNSGAVLTAKHTPVLLEETVRLWSRGKDATDEDRFFMDATVGLGGHAGALLQRDPRARMLCVDRDPEVLEIARQRLEPFKSRVVFLPGSYAEVDANMLDRIGFPRELAGVCMDLGANSFHFDEARRGFSFQNDGPLDMRYDQHGKNTLTAAEVLQKSSEVELTGIFRDLGEERYARMFAKAIVQDREMRGIEFRTTTELRTCIERAARRMPKQHQRGARGLHPATRCFQALRLYVNDELAHVERGVATLLNFLEPRARLVTIAFHSLEDRPIKQLFRQLDTEDVSSNRTKEIKVNDNGNSSRPTSHYDSTSSARLHSTAANALDVLEGKRFRLVQRKAIQASKAEVEANPRSRSARLRCVERIE